MERCSRKLAPLTKLLYNKVKLKWTEVEQREFEKIKRIVAHNILLDFPDFNKWPKSIPMMATSNKELLLSRKTNRFLFMVKKMTPKRGIG